MASELALAVQRAACARRASGGARVTQDAETGEVFVHDCPAWTKENTRLLRLLRANAEVTVRGSTSSLSGFVIIVHEPPSADASGRMWLAAGYTFALTAGLLALHSAVRAQQGLGFLWWAAASSCSN